MWNSRVSGADNDTSGLGEASRERSSCATGARAWRSIWKRSDFLVAVAVAGVELTLRVEAASTAVEALPLGQARSQRSRAKAGDSVSQSPTTSAQP